MSVNIMNMFRFMIKVIKVSRNIKAPLITHSIVMSYHRIIPEKNLMIILHKVTKYCHGGCTIECMHSHLKKLSQCKPEYVLLHIGTNNCVNSTSDEVLNKLKHLKEDIEKRLPSCIVYISLPTIRTDNTQANTIIRNLNVKLNQLNYLLMENSNIREIHLRKRGLHINDHGNRKMANNILSLIKRL